MTSNILLFAFSALTLYSFKLLIDLRAAIKSIRSHPGTRTIIDGFGPIGMMIVNHIPWVARGNHYGWKYKHADYAKWGCDILAGVGIFPYVSTDIFVADAAVIKEITTERARFPKPLDIYKLLSFFGQNIVCTEGDEWKRYRKIIAPSFSERNNRLVWEGTTQIMVDLFENVWGTKEEITVPNSTDITIPIALFIISVAGFGRRISWTDNVKSSPDYTMPFKDALHTASTAVFAKAGLPNWVMNFAPTEYLRKVKTAYDDLDQYLISMVEERRQGERQEGRYDLFSSLLDANENEMDGQTKLTDRELLGNMFIFLLAGHETTAHTLAFTFGLLALHPEQQERLYLHIKGVMGDVNVPTYEMMSSLTEPMAVFYETLRLFPAVINIPKRAAEDTSFVTQDVNGDPVVVPVPQGAGVIIDVVALHYNPKYWEDPYEFKPERFHGNWPRDAFLPFSGGARSCVGRRFSETEAIAILVMLVSRYRIEVKEEPQFAHETFAERKDRILKATRGVTLTPVRMPLVFRRR